MYQYQNYPHKKWNFNQISRNVGINWEFINKNKHAYNYEILAIHSQEYVKHKFIENIINVITYFQNVVTEELISVVWHPKNWMKFKYLDSDSDFINTRGDFLHF